MSIQYLSDNKVQITAIQIPIEDWERIKLVHPDITDTDSTIFKWHMDLLDKRLQAIAGHPELIKPINGLLELLDKAQ